MTFPDYVSFVYAPRQGGKTTTIMTEVHDLVVQNRRGEVLVIVPDMRHRTWWLNYWRDQYSATPPPQVESWTNLLNIRSRRFEKIYIEDIDMQDEGLYDVRMNDILPCLAWAREPEVVFTCSPHRFSLETLADRDERYEWQRKQDARAQETVRQARKRFRDELVFKYLALTGRMPYDARHRAETYEEG